MGVYYNKKTGNYGMRVKYYGKDFKKVIGPDKRAAEIALAEIKQEIRIAKLNKQDWQGFKKLQKTERPKMFEEAAQDYMEQLRNPKQSTLRDFNSIINSHLLPAFRNCPIKDIKPEKIRKLQSKLTTERNKTGELVRQATRVNSIISLLSSIMKQAVIDETLDKNPCDSIRRLEEQKPDIDPLSEEELDLVLNSIEEHHRPIFQVLAHTGARPNELQGLKWSDIDWKNRTIHIRRGRVRGFESTPKSKSGKRKIPMSKTVEEVLRNLGSYKLRSVEGYVFTNKKGQPYNKHLDRIWNRAERKAGLRHRPSYQLRHTFATQCIISGLPLNYIAKILGHSTIEPLMRNYAGWIDRSTPEHDDRLRNLYRTKNETVSMQKRGS